ncbi:hypothetical protein BTE77_27905 [Ensifer adhaerens]|nr:hypothetical protein BTE77_27905 [Ensifer adhaerens]
MAKHTRPRPSAIDALPHECGVIVAWVAQELRNPARTQTEIYAEFRQKLIALQGEIGLGFDIPSFSSFNRYAIDRSALMARHDRMRMLSEHVAEESDGKSDDALTANAALTLKTLILEMLLAGGEAGFSPKEALALAGALRQLQLAENLSTTRRNIKTAQFNANMAKTITAVAKETGLSKDAVTKLKREFLGIRPKAEPPPHGEGPSE